VQLIPDAAEDGDATADGPDSALLLLLRLLGSPSFTPHVTHLELTLQLLEVMLKAGLTLVHIFVLPEPFLSLKPAKHPTHGTKSARVELKCGRV